MSKQYITTSAVDSAHDSDILDVAITDKYTITVSSDGYAKFWNNKLDEIQNPKEHVHSEHIDKSGIHHVNVYENTLNFGGFYVKVVIVGYGCFNGRIVLQYFMNDDVKTLTSVAVPDEFTSGSWTPIFFKDPEGVHDYMACTQIDGNVVMYGMTVAKEENEDVEVQLTRHTELNAKESAFPISIDVSVDKKLAVGYTNGDVCVYTLEDLSLVYTFRSTDLQVSGKDQVSNSVPRVVKFSPGGKVLAIARDNQNAGSISLYDVMYAENMGSLTVPSHSNKTTIGGFAHDGWIMGLSFDEDGEYLASCGFDKCVRVWNLDNKQREATLTLSVSDFENTSSEESDDSVASGVRFIKRGVRGGLGGDNNNGLCVISFDRGVRWYREAGGI